MARMKLTQDILEAAVLGASVLGGGDADSLEAALHLGGLALKIGSPVLVDAEDLDPEGTVVTCSSVTCPRIEDPFVSARSYIRSLELLLENGVERPAALISNECSEAGGGPWMARRGHPRNSRGRRSLQRKGPSHLRDGIHGPSSRGRVCLRGFLRRRKP